MPKIQLPKIPAQSVYYLIMCSAGILLFILIGLYPLHSSLIRQDEDIGRIKGRIEEQKVLFPAYKELMLQAKLQKKELKGLPASSRTGVTLDQLANLSALFKRIAESCGLETFSVTPDAKSLANNSKSISVLVVVRGDFPKLRAFLFELERLPYLEHIEEILIQAAGEGREFRLKTWLAVSSEKST